ncbi:hypothetical protein D4S03_06820 [bacterium]|nr:MAG: hypothetical protein D4S03_06820 [bacterium]
MDLKDQLFRKIKALNETIWEHRALLPMVEGWLDNFQPDDPGSPRSERLHALHLLAQFMYFGSREIREMLRAVFRDLYKYPIVDTIRRKNNNTRDINFIKAEFSKHLQSTRFLGVGNPSESGTHLLYYFRQENGLPKTQFIHSHQIFKRYGQQEQTVLRSPEVRRYVFLDDFCGSGTQASDYSNEIVKDIKELDSSIEVDYYMLFATRSGRDFVKNNTMFDRAECVLELDDTFKCFGDACHYFLEQHEAIDKAFSLTTCRNYGLRLCPEHPLGFNDCQLLIGFHHNTPDNTLPIFWYDAPGPLPWTPLFKRYMKNDTWGTL